MTPAYERDGVTLYHGDCLDALASIESESFDALITDPPYGIGFTYRGGKEIASTPSAYWEWLRPRYEAALRCVRPGGFVAVWNAHKNFRHFWDWFGDEIRIYAAGKNFVQLRDDPINLNGYDPVVMFYKAGADPLRPAKQTRSVNFSVANTADMRRLRATKGHPCPRPLDQVREIVDNFALPDGRVLDPFAGSGTTLVACLKTGREAVGIEIDESYCAIVRRRLAAAATPLFDAIGGQA